MVSTALFEGAISPKDNAFRYNGAKGHGRGCWACSPWLVIIYSSVTAGSNVNAGCSRPQKNADDSLL